MYSVQGWGGSGDKPDKAGQSRRGTLSEISKNLPWTRRESQAEVISKIRKRRETSADITIFGRGSVVDLKSDMSRVLTVRQKTKQHQFSKHRSPYK